ncbi:MAG: hypothetical protein KDD27_12410, partial [Saprospiraceae bacterium]|nr:hypothetical protein [Saprospiraceae bacterium]
MEIRDFTAEGKISNLASQSIYQKSNQHKYTIEIILKHGWFCWFAISCWQLAIGFCQLPKA